MLTDILDRLDKVNRREEDPRYYYVWHSRLFNTLLFLLLVGLAVWSAVLYFAVSRPEALSWAQTSEGKTVPLYSVEEPQYTTQAIENWVENALKVSYSYDFNNMANQINAARPYFSQEAWTLFTDQLEKNVMPSIIKNQMLVSIAVDKAKVAGAPQAIAGIMSWNVQVPGMISFTTGSETKSEKVMFYVTVTRQLTYTNPKGLWITKLTEVR